MARAQRLWTKACWTPRVLTLRSPRYANGVVALRRRSGMPSRGRKGAVRVESLPAASGRQLSQKRRDQALRLLAEARELLLGQQSATFQRRDPPQRSGTAQVVEQTSHFFLALVEEAIDNDIPLVGAKARVPVKPFAILQHTLAEPFKRDRMQLPKNLPVRFLDFAHHCPPYGHVIVPPAKIELAELAQFSTDETRRQFNPNIEIVESQNRTLAPAPVNRRRRQTCYFQSLERRLDWHGIWLKRGGAFARYANCRTTM